MSTQTLARPLSMQPFASGLNPSRPISMQSLASGVNRTRPISFHPFATTVNQPRPQLGQAFDPAELCRRLKMHERQQKDEEEKKRIRASQVIEEEQYQEVPQFASIDFAKTSTVPDRSSKRDMRRLPMLEEEENVGPACELSSSKGDHTSQRAQHIESAAAQLEGPRESSSISRKPNKARHTTFDFSSFGSQTQRPISHAPADPAPTSEGYRRPFGKGHARSLSTGDVSRGTNIAEVIEQQHRVAEAAKKPRFSYMCEEGYDWSQGEETDESMKMYPTRTKRNSKFRELFVPPSVWFVNKSSSALTSPAASASSVAPTHETREASSNTVSSFPTSPTLTENKKFTKVRFDTATDTSTKQTPRSQRKRISAFFFQRASFSSTTPASQPTAAPPPAASSSSPSAAPAPVIGREGKNRKAKENPSGSNNQGKRKSAFFRDLFRKSEGGKRWKWK